MAEEGNSLTLTATPQQPEPEPPVAVPSVASLPGVEVPVSVVEVPVPVVEGAQGVSGVEAPDQPQSGSVAGVKAPDPIQPPQSGSEANVGWPPSDFRIVDVVDDDDASSVATTEEFYDRVAEKPFQTLSMWDRDGSYSTLYQPRHSEGRIREGGTPTAKTPPPVSRLPQWSVVPKHLLRTFSVFDRPRSVAAEPRRSSLPSFMGRPSDVHPAPLAVPPEMPPMVDVPRPASMASQGSIASHLPEHISAIGTVVAGVVRDMLAAHQDDAQRRQEVQLQMMLMQKEETEIRVQEAHQSADKQIKLMREIQQTEAHWRKRKLETEKRIQKEREDHQAQLAELIRVHRESAVQKELQQKPSMRVSFPQCVESLPPSRASTPSPPHAFVYDYDPAAADNCATVNGDDMHDVGVWTQGAV